MELLVGIRSLSARYRVQKFFSIDPADGIAFLDFYNRGNKSRLDDFYFHRFRSAFLRTQKEKQKNSGQEQYVFDHYGFPFSISCGLMA